MRSKADLIFPAVVCATILSSVLAAPIYTYVKAHYNQRTITLVIKKTERVQDGNSSYYLAYTENNGVYTVADSFWRWSFDSSDRYGMLDAGGTYVCTVTGWRWNFFTSYPNLLTVAETSAQ